MQSGSDRPETISSVVAIVSAYVGHNSLPQVDLPALISAVHRALEQAGLGEGAPVAPERAKPAEIRRSITPDHLISFEDGRPYRSLKRHLATRGLTPHEYRTKWGLPLDYPMIAPTYAARRSELARAMGLGQIRKRD